MTDRDRDIVGTRAEAEELERPPLVVLEELDELLPGSGPIAVRRVGAGHSNESFFVSRDDRRWVLRRPPRPPYAPTAHDVIREYRVLKALMALDLRAPRPYALCTDAKMIGTPFYVMERVEGKVIRDHFPPGLDAPAERRRALEEFVDALVEIHAAPWRGTDFEQIARPSGYLDRQVRRWMSQWGRNKTREVPEIEAMGEWLARNIPAVSETTIVHGDYKLDNAIYATEPPARLAAILDWEMSTLGAPLADLGLLCATYVERGDEVNGVFDFSPATALDGALTRSEIVERYAQRSGRAVDDLNWYEGLALWKIAILLEGSRKRYLAGSTADPLFALLDDGVPWLAARALGFAEIKPPG